MRKGRGVLGTIFKRLAECIFKMQPIIIIECGVGQGAPHRLYVFRRESECLQISETPVRLAERGLELDSATVGSNAIRRARSSLQGMSVAQPDTRLINRFLEHRLVFFNRRRVLAEMSEDSRAEVPIAEVFRIFCEEVFDFHQRLFHFGLSEQDQRVVMPGTLKPGRQSEAMFEQGLRVWITPQAGTDFREHTQSRHIGRPLGQVLTQQLLGARHVVCQHRIGGSHQARISIGRAEELQSCCLRFSSHAADIQLVRQAAPRIGAFRTHLKAAA
jgi:hypothetical protein